MKEITALWPQVDDLRGDDVDGSRWSVAFDVSPAHVISAILWAHVDEVVPIYLETALNLGLNVYDPQASLLHSAGQKARALAPRAPSVRICAKCGKPIDPGQPSAETPGRDGVFHLACFLGQN